MKVTREQWLAAAINLIGMPYQYGGRGEIEGEWGVDCSGLIALAFWKAGDRDVARELAKLNCAAMWKELALAEHLEWYLTVDRSDLMPPDVDLAFYGPALKPSHVVIVVGGESGPVISASNGSSEVDTLQEAHEKGAQVRAFSSASYRKDLLGYRSLRKYFRP